MESEGILLRQTQHMKTVISQLNVQNFAETFGDIKLVFTDGEFSYYKVLLEKLFPKWKEMLESSGGADLIILEKLKKEEFLWQVTTDQEGFLHCLVDGEEEAEQIKVEEKEFDDNYLNTDHSYGAAESFANTDHMSSGTIEFANSKSNPVMYHKVDQTISERDIIDMENVELELSSDERIVSAIAPDFSWPSKLEKAPNYHSKRWGQKSGVVLEVMGNRSFFTLLVEKYDNLPSSTTFSVNSSENEEGSCSGIFNLRDFVNSGVDQNIAAFVVGGSEEEVSLVEIIKSRRCKDGGLVEESSKSINILLGGKCQNLKELINIWKKEIIADTSDKELVRYSRVDKKLMDWLQSEVKKTSDGGLICCYCGLVCFEQSLSGNFRVHMKKHLYRKKFCYQCKRSYWPQDDHTCKTNIRVKINPCTECSELFYSRSNLVSHLKRKHNIIDKVVIIKECFYCSKQVANLSKHYSEFHKNEKLFCQFCDKVFTNPDKLRSHVNISHTKAYSGFCNLCQKEYNNLKKHTMQSHNEKRFPCDHCEKVFKYQISLDNHMQSVKGTREKEPCPECGNLYVNVKDHIRTFHRGLKKKSNVKYCLSCLKAVPRELFDDHKLTCKEEETICHICSTKVLKIRQHLAMKHQVFDRRCYICENDFYNTIDLNKHLRVEHFPKFMMEPELFGMVLQTEDKKQREEIANKFVSLHSKQSEGKIECQFCKYKTTTAIFMITHMKEHLGYTLRKGKHPHAEKQKVCPDCGKIVKYSKSDHLKRCKKSLDKLVILDGIPGTAEVISSSYEHHGDMANSQENMKQKVNTLTATELEEVKQAEFSCEKCDKKFKKQAYLRKHLKRVHSDATLSCEMSDPAELEMPDDVDTRWLLGQTDQEMLLEMDQETRKVLVHDVE